MKLSKEEFNIQTCNIKTQQVQAYRVKAGLVSRGSDSGESYMASNVEILSSGTLVVKISDDSEEMNLYKKVRRFFSQRGEVLLCAGSLEALWYRGEGRIKYIFPVNDQAKYFSHMKDVYTKKIDSADEVTFSVRDLFDPAPREVILDNRSAVDFKGMPKYDNYEE